MTKRRRHTPQMSIHQLARCSNGCFLIAIVFTVASSCTVRKPVSADAPSDVDEEPPVLPARTCPEVEESKKDRAGALLERSGYTVQGWAVLAEKDLYGETGMMSDIFVDYVNLEWMRTALVKRGWKEDQLHEVREFDREALLKELDWLRQNAGLDDVVLFYVAAHGQYLGDFLHWNSFIGEQWRRIESRRRLLIVDACRAAEYTAPLRRDPGSYLSIAVVDSDEYGWWGLSSENLPIVGSVFVHYFTSALDNPRADQDGNGIVSVQEATAMTEEHQRAYMHEVVLTVPEMVEQFASVGFRPMGDPTFPDVIIDDTICEPLYLDLEVYQTNQQTRAETRPVYGQ